MVNVIVNAMMPDLLHAARNRNEVGWANSINYKLPGRTREKIRLSLTKVYTISSINKYKKYYVFFVSSKQKL